MRLDLPVLTLLVFRFRSAPGRNHWETLPARHARSGSRAASTQLEW